MSPAWLVLLLARLPCLPAELGQVPTSRPALPPPPPPPPPPARAAARRPSPPPLAMRETARYRVDYGALSIGEISLAITDPARDGAALVQASGQAQGSILGFGRLENHIEAVFDAEHLSSRRWTSARSGWEGDIRDTGEQPRQGLLDLTRARDGRPPERLRAAVAGPALDPVGFLLRVRVAPPPIGGPPQVLYVLDGRALWRVTLVSAGLEPLPDTAARTPALRLEGHADPIRYDGTVDDRSDRSRRELILWLSPDAAHVPLRLSMPIGISDLVVALVDLDRR
jgi:hypothetical protein